MKDLARASRLASLLCAVFGTVGLAVLVGWIAGNEALKTIYPGSIAIKTNTVIALLCLGILAVTLLLSAVMWWTAAAVQRHAAGQARAEAAERTIRDQLTATLEGERHERAMAERSNRMKEEFLATLSHELRTPLNAILGWVQLLVRGNLPDRDAKRGLEAIERNSRLQAQLIEDLLDMSRIESGTLRLDVQNVDMALVVESAIATVAPAAAAKNLTLARELEPNAAPIQGDPTRLQQVLWNFLSNAIKFTPPNGHILVSLRSTVSHVEVAVTDTGVGIAREFLGHVFDRFRQADPSTTRRHGGLGLGLSIARQLTELHGGSIGVLSEGEGRGATFVLQLPVSADSSVGLFPPSVPPAVHDAGTGKVAMSLGGVRVLLVDDHDDACELAERILKAHGAEVATARSVDGAVECLERRPFDALVSDIGMPGRDGYDLIRFVRARYPSLPAVALTAFASAEDVERALAAGFQRHLSKPIAPGPLIAAVTSVVEVARTSPLTRSPSVERLASAFTTGAASRPATF